MNTKIIAIIAVAVVVVAGGAAAFVLMSDNGKDRHDDYTMLADSSNFVKGFSYFLDSTYDGKTIESFKVTIDERKGDFVNYTLEYRDIRTDAAYTKAYFFSAFEFSVDDAVEDLPEGITVVKESNTYTINGREVLTAYHGFRCNVEFNNVVLTADGSNFVTGSGTVKYVSDDDVKAGSLDIDYTFTTRAGVCDADIVLDEITLDTWDVNELFSYPLTPKDLYLSHYTSYSPVKTGETKKVGNVDCDVYTFTVIDETYSLCVYKGIILQKECTSDGKHVETLHVDKN